MDYFSHGIWSYIFFHRIRVPIYAVLFGLLPDTTSWGIYLFYRLFTGQSIGKPVLGEIPNWAYMLYNISHSLIVACAVIAVVSIIYRKLPIFMLAWPIAIVMDLLTHSRSFLPTPFLWPISEWRFPGIAWSSKSFIIANIAAMTISLGIIFYLRYRKRRS